MDIILYLSTHQPSVICKSSLLTLQCTAARSYGQPSPKRELDQARIPREKFYLFSHDFLRVHWDIAIRFIIVRIHNLLWILTFLNSGTALHLFIQAAIDIILIRYLFSYPILRIWISTGNLPTTGRLICLHQ